MSTVYDCHFVALCQYVFAVELPIPKPNMATPPGVHQPINAKHGYETEGHQKTLLIQNNNAMLDHLF